MGPCMVLLAAMLAADPAPAPAGNDRFGFSATSWSHLGANTDAFDRERGLKRLAALRDAGAGWDRCDFWWGRIEPEQGRFDYRDYDWMIDQYRAQGVRLMPILCYASAWSGGDAPTTPEERALFARYVFNTVSRYRDAVSAWEIWNEPNIGDFWEPAPDAADYALLLREAHAAAKRADPACTVVGAATAGADLGFIEQLLEHGGGQWMDAVSIHPYQGDLGSLSPDTGGLESQVRAVRHLLADYGLRTPVWITEVGHRTTGTHGHTSVSEAQQAAYVIRTYAIAFAAGAERLFWFNLQDWQEYWGVIRQDFERKPSFAAYRFAAATLEGREPAGELDLGAGVRAIVFDGGAGRVALAWSPDDQERTLSLPARSTRRWDGAPIDPARAVVGMDPVLLSDLTDEARLRPLPPPPALAPPPRLSREAPALPAAGAAWHAPDAPRRVAVAVDRGDTLGIATPVRIDASDLPSELAGADHFDVHGADGFRAVAQRDLDGRVALLLPPSGPASQTLWLYPRDAASPPAVVADETALRSETIELTFERRCVPRPLRVFGTFETRAEQNDGLFTASYKDTAGGWPRVGFDTEVLQHASLSGPVFGQYRSRVKFGPDAAVYEFTFTAWAGAARLSYHGRWIDDGDGATLQVNHGDTYPSGTRVTGLYADAILPASGVNYGQAVAIEPPGVEVSAVLVAPGGKLSTHHWADRSVVGAGLLWQTRWPADVTAEMFWFNHRLEDPRGEARRRLDAVRRGPAARVGPLEARP